MMLNIVGPIVLKVARLVWKASEYQSVEPKSHGRTVIDLRIRINYQMTIKVVQVSAPQSEEVESRKIRADDRRF